MNTTMRVYKGFSIPSTRDLVNPLAEMPLTSGITLLNPSKNVDVKVPISVEELAQYPEEEANHIIWESSIQLIDSFLEQFPQYKPQ